MLLRDLLALPVGTHVFGQIHAVTNVPGIVESFKDGSRFIHWTDGYATIPFGKVRDYDEYIAAHTQLVPNGPDRILRERSRKSGRPELRGRSKKVLAK